MKIHNNIAKTVSLSDISIGEVFEVDNGYYIRTDETKYPDDHTILILCVDLAGGRMCEFDCEMRVHQKWFEVFEMEEEL